MPAMEFKPCPYCNGESIKLERVRRRFGYNGLDYPIFSDSYSARCRKCHARGPVVTGKVVSVPPGFDLPSWATDPAELRRRAVLAWNWRGKE